MAEELTCGVCSERYSGGRHEPVVLPSCGHAFCRLCLTRVQAADGALSCPACRAAHRGPPVDRLPAVYALLSLAEAFGRRPDKKECGEHGSSSPLEFWCRDCRRELCGRCLLLGSHVREGHLVGEAGAFLEEEREGVGARGALLAKGIAGRRAEVAARVEGLVARLALLAARESHALSDLARRAEGALADARGAPAIEALLEASASIDGLQAELEQLSPPPSGEATAPADGGGGRTAPDGEGSGRGRNEDTQEEEEEEEDPSSPPRSLRTPWPLKCCAVAEDGRRGRLRWHNGRLHLHALAGVGDAHADADAHVTFQMPLVMALASRESPEAFMDVSSEGRPLGRLYIRLEGRLRRARHFLALCLGTLGPSYRGSRFHNVARRGAPGETLAGGRYLTAEGTSVEGVMRDLEWGGPCMREKALGSVVGASGGRSEIDAFFHICTREHRGKRFACAFGRVVEGMEAAHDAVRVMGAGKAVSVADVGVALGPEPALRRTSTTTTTTKALQEGKEEENKE